MFSLAFRLSPRTAAVRSPALGTIHKSASFSTFHRTHAMSPPEKKQRTEEYILYYVRLIWGSSGR